MTPGQRRYAVFVFCLLNIFSLVDRGILAVMLPEIRDSLGLTDFEVSLVQGLAFALFYSWVGIWAGGLVDRYRRRPILYWGATLWSIAAGASGLAQSYAQLFIARMMVGVGEATLTPASQSMIADMFRRERLAGATSIFVASGVLGISLSLALGGWLMDLFARSPLPGPLGELEPWRQVLLITGIPGVAVALLALTLREPARSGDTGGAAAANWGEFGRYLADRRKLFIKLILGYGLASMTSYALLTWGATYGRRAFEMTAGSSGGLIGMLVILQGIAALVSGQLVDRLYARGYKDAILRYFAVAALIAVPLGVAGYAVQDFTMFVIGTGAIVMLIGSATGLAIPAMLMIAPGRMRGRLSAMTVFTINVFGVAVAPMLVGALTDFVYGSPDKVGWSIATVIGICGTSAGLLIWSARHLFAQVVQSMETTPTGTEAAA